MIILGSTTQIKDRLSIALFPKKFKINYAVVHDYVWCLTNMNSVTLNPKIILVFGGIIYSVYFICFLNLYGKSEERSSHLSLNSPIAKKLLLLKITENSLLN